MPPKPPLNPAQPIHWILDWDGTITQHDTLNALVSIAASCKPNSPVLSDWTRVSEAYMADYNAAMDTLAPGGKLPETVEQEKKLLSALSSVEQASLDRVSAAGIFAGLTRELIDEGARNVVASRRVEIRNGFSEFLNLTQSRGDDNLHLLSVNWSRHFIHSSLQAAGAPVQKQSIYANELDGIEGNQISKGRISPDDDAEMKIISSGDKLDYMAQLRRRDRELQRADLDASRPVVYVGDSWTDIECLLEADLGICIRDQPVGSSQRKLAERLQSLGIPCPRLQDWGKADARQVVWARDFAEVQAWLEAHGAGIR